MVAMRDNFAMKQRGTSKNQFFAASEKSMQSVDRFLPLCLGGENPILIIDQCSLVIERHTDAYGNAKHGKGTGGCTQIPASQPGTLGDKCYQYLLSKGLASSALNFQLMASALSKACDRAGCQSKH